MEKIIVGGEVQDQSTSTCCFTVREVMRLNVTHSELTVSVLVPSDP